MHVAIGSRRWRRLAQCQTGAALNGFRLSWPSDRILRLEVGAATVPTGRGDSRPVLIIRVKRPASRKTVLRPRKQSS